MMNRILGIILFITSTYIPNLAQNIENFSYRLQGDSIVVNYDLSGVDRDVIVQLFSSNDDFANPLKLVSGSVGEEVQQGQGKTIVWKAKEELGSFKGSVRLKLTTRYAPYLELKTETLLDSYRRGKTYLVSYESNIETISWSLLKGEEEISGGDISSGSENFEMPLSSNLKKGNDYRLLLEGGGLTDGSETFSVKPKYPLLLKAVPILIVGTVVTILLMQPDEPEDIPDPFLPE